MKRTAFEIFVLVALVAVYFAFSSSDEVSSGAQAKASFYWSERGGDYSYFFELASNGKWHAVLCSDPAVHGELKRGNYLAQGRIKASAAQAFVSKLEQFGLWELSGDENGPHILRLDRGEREHEVRYRARHSVLDSTIEEGLPGKVLRRLRQRQLFADWPDWALLYPSEGWPGRNTSLRRCLFMKDDFRDDFLSHKELIEEETVLLFFQPITTNGGHREDFTVRRLNDGSLSFERYVPMDGSRSSFSLAQDDYDRLVAGLLKLGVEELKLQAEPGYDGTYLTIFLRNGKKSYFYQWYDVGPGPDGASAHHEVGDMLWTWCRTPKYDSIREDCCAR